MSFDTSMKNTIQLLVALRRPLLLGALLIPFAGAALAQPRTDERPNRGERRAERRAQRGRFARGEDGPGRRRPASAKRQLSGVWRRLDRVENQAPLSKQQAARVVNLIRPWTTRAQMSDADAAQLQTQLAAVWTPAQAELMERRGPREGGGRGEGEGRGGRGPRGEGRGEGGFGGPREGRGEGGFGGRRGEREGMGRGAGVDPAQRQAMRGFMENLNPFYAPTGYSQWKSLPQPAQERLAKRYRESRATLEALSRKAKG